MLMCIKGLIDIYQGAHDEGLAKIEAANKLDPNNLQFKIQLRYAKLYCGQYNKDLRPEYKVPSHVVESLTSAAIQIHLVRGEMREALEYTKLQIQRVPDYPQNYVFAALAQAALGLNEEARRSLRTVKQHNPKFSLDHVFAIMPLRDTSVLKEALEKLRTLSPS